MAFSELHSRRQTAGVCLILGPGLTLAGWSMFPSVDSEATTWVPDVASAQTQSAIAAVLVIVGLAFSILAYLALVHLLREREPLLGDVGGLLAILGGTLVAAVMGYVVAEVELIRHLGDTEATATAIQTIDDSAPALAMFAGPPLLTVGLVVLAAGLMRAQATPWPWPVLLGAGAVAQAVGIFAFEDLAVTIAGFAAMFVALAAIGIQLLAEPDEAWEHAPVFRGFHAVPTA